MAVAAVDLCSSEFETPDTEGPLNLILKDHQGLKQRFSHCKNGAVNTLTLTPSMKYY